MSHAVVTGANRGIGLELCRQLVKRGDRVTALCRSPSAELESLALTVIAGIDLCDAEAVATLVDDDRLADIDLLINNAGLLERSTGLDDDAIRRQFEINALAPLRLSLRLARRIREGGKIAMITSRMGSIADNSSGGAFGYRMSKAALNMAGVSLSHDLKRQGIAVVLLHPGHVRTEMTGNTGMVDAAEAAAGLLARIDELTLDSSGEFKHASGASLPW